LGPTITKIGQALLGSPELGITPEFSRVLRHRILKKDDRWMVLHLRADRGNQSATPSQLRVVPGFTGMENPFYVPKSQIP